MSEQEKTAESCLWCENKPRLVSMLRTCLSDETRSHFRTSKVEFLKGVRGLIDARLEHLSRSQQKGSSVIVE